MGEKVRTVIAGSTSAMMKCSIAVLVDDREPVGWALDQGSKRLGFAIRVISGSRFN